MSDQKLIIGYYRLSMEDDSEGESNSIINQRKLVKDYISNIPELASMPFQEFYDDGYSGSSMERPAIKQVLELARENKVQCIVVKDFSRFARNYIEMGTYLEQIFPFLGVRFISISDRYDSKDYKGKSSDIEVQFKGLIADFYVKDQSVKVKAAVSTRRGKGEYCCGSAPYGYRINPENKKELVIVEDEAEVIRRVFELTNQRYSKMEICRLFNEEGVLTPLQSIDFKGRENHVLLMHIEPSMEVHANQADEVFMRVGNKSKKLAFEERMQLMYDKGERFFEDKPVPEADIEDIDLAFVEKYIAQIGYSKTAMEYLRENKGFIKEKMGKCR